MVLTPPFLPGAKKKKKKKKKLQLQKPRRGLYPQWSVSGCVKADK